MKTSEKYQFNKKLRELGKLSWDLLIAFSKITIFLFLILTAIIFWMNMANQLFLGEIVMNMIYIVTILTILIGIDMVINLKN